MGKRIYPCVLAFLVMFTSSGINLSAANFEAAAVMGVDNVVENILQEEEIDEADPASS